MRTNDLIQAMRLAARSLTDENSHAEAVIIGESAERLTVLANRLRRAGLSAEEAEVDKGRRPPTEPIDAGQDAKFAVQSDVDNRNDVIRTVTGWLCNNREAITAAGPHVGFCWDGESGLSEALARPDQWIVEPDDEPWHYRCRPLYVDKRGINALYSHGVLVTLQVDMSCGAVSLIS